MSTQHGGGNRKPTAKKAVAGGTPTHGTTAGGPDADAEAEAEALTSDAEPSATRATTKAATRPTAAKSTGSRAAAGKSTGGSGAKATGRPAVKPGGKPGARKPVTPVRVSKGRNWGPIVLFAVVGIIAAGIIGYGGWAVYQNGLTWSDRAAKIEGLVNWRKKDPKVLEYPEGHKWGPIDYSKMPMNPPVGGTHNYNWQQCLGNVYDAPIATEHAIHSMEHGAVWITYKPDLAKPDVDKLAKRVRGQDFTLMSPYPSQDTPISLQTWGYQLKLTSASDPRIDEFLKDLRQVSTVEQGVTCSSGNMITETGTTPRDLGKDQQQQQGAQPGGGGDLPPADPNGQGAPPAGQGG